ncbi:uncharacterized protein LOC130666622 isoform X5 [Microplitis mediator]|uniref:uncharacterized protein LOC130666622 isoform X5 n=1 Tax=Microplitis mediator TaxID=375433 RepID=UPI0025562CB1|nr:uncharacterized protein LOC130666622 isoform X5 [Microplitis mediator]
MTSLILENADLNRLFPKCRPRGGHPPQSGAGSHHQTTGQQPHDRRSSVSTCKKLEPVTTPSSLSSSSSTSVVTGGSGSGFPYIDMIDLEHDNNTDRCRKRATSRRKKSGSLSRRTASIMPGFEAQIQSQSHQQQQQQQILTSHQQHGMMTTTKPVSSSSSSSASGRSEDAPNYGSLGGSDHQGQSQQDDSGPEEGPVYILTSAKGDRSYKLRDSRIIEIAGGREVFSQSRGKVAARKPRFLTSSKSVPNDESTGDKLTVKKNSKSPNRQSVWELRSRCGEARRQRANREITETVFSSEVHSVRRNPTKSIIDYDSPKAARSNRIINYDSVLNSNNVEYSVGKSITDIDCGLPKNCIDYQSNHTTPARSMAIVSDGEVVVFDDIDDNWQGLRLDLGTTNNTTTNSQINTTSYLNSDQDDVQQQQQQQRSSRIPPEPPGSSVGSSPSPTSMYPRNTSDFFKVITPASDCEVNSPSPERNHKVARVIGELPIAQYSGSPRRYGVRENSRLPNILSSPSIYMTPRPGFPQRILPTTPNQKEKETDYLTAKEEPVVEVLVDTTTSPTPEKSNSNLIVTSHSVEEISTSQDLVSQSNESKTQQEEEEEEEEDFLKPSFLSSDNLSSLVAPGGSTFDYLYEFSETRKVLEEFFKCPAPTEEKENNGESFPFQDLDYELRRQGGNSYVGQRLASGLPNTEEVMVHESPKKQRADFPPSIEHENNFLDLSVGTGSSEDLGETEVGLQVGHSRNFTLSPETTDCDSNCGDLDSEMSLMMMDNELLPASGLLGSVGDLGNNSDSLRIYTSMPVLEDGLSSGHASDTDNNNPTVMLMKRQINEIEKEIIQRTRNDMLGTDIDNEKDVSLNVTKDILQTLKATSPDLFIAQKENSYETNELNLDGLDPLGTPPPPAPQGRQSINLEIGGEVEAAIKDIRMALQKTKTLPVKSPSEEPPEPSVSPIWIPSMLDGRRRICTESNSEDSEARRVEDENEVEVEEVVDEEEADTDLETDRLLGQQRTDDQGFYDDKEKEGKKKSRNKEGLLDDPSVLIEGVLFRARYLGSTQLVCEGQPTKSTRMCQAEEAVSRIKAPDGETQPSAEVDLFISTEKIMVLNTDLKEIMMDHALRTISYIADIGDLVVLMARRRFVPHEMEEAPKINRTPKMICHVFESEEAQFIAQSIGQAFQVAYMEFLKANGIEDHSFVKEMDYQEVLNSQEIFGDELQMFAKKEMQKEVVVPKAKGEILGVVIVESGWGSMLPTVVIANLAPAGAAARCGQLNIGDQIIAINGVSLVGLPLSTCQTYIKNSKNQTVVKLTVVPCAPVVEVKIKRPDTKYQLGFSVQNGVICSLLRGGIAERGGVRVGHRIIEINNQSVVAVPHEKIVNLLATSVGEILMKTMPTSMFRLLTGQESPVYI